MAKRRKKLGALSIAMANLSGQGLRTAVMELLCFILAALDIRKLHTAREP